MLCNKLIYKHQHVAVCSVDGRIFHGACLGFDKDSCFHIQSGSLPDWFCPMCARDIFPLYDDIAETSNVSCLCANCKLSRGNQPSTFNPFQFDSDDSNTFNDSMCETLLTANDILNNCKYLEINSEYNPNNTFTSFYFDNIDGFKSNFNESLINIHSMERLPSIITFCETNFKHDEPDEYVIGNYNAEHFHAIENKKKGSGISLYYDKTHLFHRMPALNTRNKYFESMGGYFKSDLSNFYVIVVYRFHNNTSEFTEHFLKFISEYKEKPLLILGDFNIDLLNYDNDPNIDNFVNLMISNAFFPLIDKATNFFRDGKTLLDHAWCNILHKETCANILEVSVSSHKPLLVTVPTEFKHYVDESDSINKNITIHNVNNDTIKAFSPDFDTLISSHNIRNDCTDGLKPDANDARNIFSDFYTNMHNIYNTHIVVNKVLTSKRNKYEKPWITQGLAKACRIKSKLHNKWIKSRGTSYESICKVEYKAYRTKLKNLIRTSEVNHFKSQFDNSCGNIKKAWNVINTIRCKKKMAQFPRFIDINSTIITNRRQLCQEFNKYFINVANNLNTDKYQDTPPPDHSCYLKNSVQSSIFLSNIEKEEVSDIWIIRNLMIFPQSC